MILKEASAVSDAKQEIEDMIEKYSSGFGDKVSYVGASSSRRTNGTFSNGHVVLLTGSTGGLGSYLLASLLNNKDVTVVYAFNRPSKTGTIKQRQRAAFEDRGLETALLESEKLVYVEGDTAQQTLGLTSQLYEEVKVPRVDMILKLLIPRYRFAVQLP